MAKMSPMQLSLGRRMPHLIDMTGRRIGTLLVVKQIQGDRSSSKWLVRCDCGKERILRGHNLRTTQRSCGCKKRELLCCSRKRNPELVGFRYVLSIYKESSKKRGLEFTLPDEEFNALIKSRCHYCGDEPNNKYRLYKRTACFFYNGIDRVDNALGYKSGNCVPCCWICNFGKQKKTTEMFLNWIEKVHEWQKKAQ